MCPVSALLAYLAVHLSRGQHLSVWEDGKLLSRSEFGHLLKKALKALLAWRPVDTPATASILVLQLL